MNLKGNHTSQVIAMNDNIGVNQLNKKNSGSDLAFKFNSYN